MDFFPVGFLKVYLYWGLYNATFQDILKELIIV